MHQTHNIFTASSSNSDKEDKK